MPGLKLNDIYFSYYNGYVVKGVNFAVAEGEMVGLLGPNGSGKSTLLKLSSGLLRPSRGDITLDGSPMSKLKRKEVARQVAVVPQQFYMPFAFKVREVIMLGRLPFLKMLEEEREPDRQAVTRAMQLADVTALADRFFNELSGGEQQKVVLAMALAQQPRLLLLDEPTLHLDISRQVEILEVVRLLNAEQGVTVVAAMHDLNLSALYFKRLVLLQEGRIVADGPPSQVLTAENIAKVYGARVRVEHYPSENVPHIVVLPSQITRN